MSKEIKTHKELIKIHGAKVSYHYNNRIIIGTISVRHINKKEYVYLCNNMYGSSVKDLKVEEYFGYNRAHMISFSTGLGRYEFKSKKITKIRILSKRTKPKGTTLNIEIKCEGLETWITMYNKFEENLSSIEDSVRNKEKDMNNEWTSLTTTPSDFGTNENYVVQYYIQDYEKAPVGEGYYSKWTDCDSSLSFRSVIAMNIHLGLKYRFKEIKMNKKEEALKELEEIKKRTAVLEGILKAPEYYPCVTPVEKHGQILFNKNKQLLRVTDRGYYVVESPVHISEYCDYSDDFVWVPCKRSTLKVGDIVHFTETLNRGHFENTERIGKVLNDKEIAYVNENRNVFVTDLRYQHYYKLVSKEEL